MMMGSGSSCCCYRSPDVPLLAIRVELRWAIVGLMRLQAVAGSSSVQAHHETLSRVQGTSASGVKCAGEPNSRRRRQHSTAMGVQQQGDGGTAGGDGYARD